MAALGELGAAVGEPGLVAGLLSQALRAYKAFTEKVVAATVESDAHWSRVQGGVASASESPFVSVCSDSVSSSKGSSPGSNGSSPGIGWRSPSLPLSAEEGQVIVDQRLIRAGATRDPQQPMRCGRRRRRRERNECKS